MILIYIFSFIMFQVDTIQLKKPMWYKFVDHQDFLEAQLLAQQEIEKFISYKKFVHKADLLRQKSWIETQKDLEAFLSD
jgi:hypothetical protein